jgi:hypothetical protein
MSGVGALIVMPWKQPPLRLVCGDVVVVVVVVVVAAAAALGCCPCFRSGVRKVSASQSHRRRISSPLCAVLPAI